MFSIGTDQIWKDGDFCILKDYGRSLQISLNKNASSSLYVKFLETKLYM